MDRLDARDVESHLCVMLLMLQSADRETKEILKVFRDRGDIHGFFPPEGAQRAHRRALDQTSNLHHYGGELFPMVKDSLGNALRVIRPVVVVDEGHGAISDLAFKALYGFKPRVLELTATPKDVKARGGKNPRRERHANLLVELTGAGAGPRGDDQDSSQPRTPPRHRLAGDPECSPWHAEQARCRNQSIPSR